MELNRNAIIIEVILLLLYKYDIKMNRFDHKMTISLKTKRVNVSSYYINNLTFTE